MSRILGFVLLCTLSAVSGAQEDCQPSRWGPDDEIGNANLITAESVLAASKLVRTGKAYSLGITVDSTTPAFPPRSLDLQVVQPGQQQGARAMPNSTYNDDVFIGWLGIGSQLDGLGHIGDENGIHYNCFDARDIAQFTGLTKLGIHTVPPMVARGIILDMAAYRGVPYLKAGEHFSAEDVKAVEKKQGTAVREGDVVLFHTGWTDAKLESAPEEWVAAEPGIDPSVAHYLAGKNVVAVGADTWGVDVIPAVDANAPFPGHVILLKESGIYLLETMNTGPLVRDGAHEFLFVLGQAKIRGAVQMIINPVAIR
ncbi:cyclase family protein [Pseudohalioglobus sediminis]|uniref:Cyclase family protein n=1 Tax=Pseudohalioglobus sediminis TaxID=2606449 RepID=A0A5B0WXZ0_9GAMM|nr:cyclase family protein [Pseudohalioglobus sediminis]KAA1191944.1 cyclase family protein [Pseudohalioglobus sediminis]